MRKEPSNISNNFFWPSYVDLMTSLFVVTLVLFVLSYSLFKVKEQDLVEQKNVLQEQKAKIEVLANQFKKIKEIEKSLENLEGEYFTFQPEFKRHELKYQVQFAKRSSQIPFTDIQPLINAGKALEQVITDISQQNAQQGMQVSYLIIIEGSASTDNYMRNYELSYERALAVAKLWKANNIALFNNRDDTYEVQISGTGTGGVGRYEDSNFSNEKNQRILVQIIPKVGSF